MTKVLFICNQNKNRSRTAEDIFKNKFETRSAGLFNKRPVTKKELSWADAILVMEEEQRDELALRFPEIYNKKRILNLDIPDIYTYGNKDLITSLRSKIRSYEKLL